MGFRVKGFFKLMRPGYWLMTGGLSILTALVLQKGSLDLESYSRIFVSMALIASGGFAINDYFDQKADAIVKPYRPIPSKAVSPRQAVGLSAMLFLGGLTVAFFINALSFAIVLVDTVLLIFYSSVLKRRSGFLSNMLVGAMIMTSFLFGEASVLGQVTILSFSLSLSTFGSISGNIMRDVLSLDGDIKAGYPTLPQEVGVKPSSRLSAVFLLLCVLGSLIPFVLGVVGFGYLFPVIIWDAIIFYSAISLLRKPDARNVKKHERIMTMAMILLPLSLVAGAYT